MKVKYYGNIFKNFFQRKSRRGPEKQRNETLKTAHL